MRTAITIGITEKGKAEIISHPDVPIDQQRRAFNELGRKKGKSEFVEVQLWENGSLRRRNRFTADSEGGVNFNSAHPVEKQQAKGKKKETLPDLSPTYGDKGGVNFDAAKPVSEPGKKTAKKKAKKSVEKASAKKTAKKAPATPASEEKSASDPTL